jgi:hypothetical protein
MVRKIKEPTATGLVFDVMVRTGDFHTAPQLANLTGKTHGQVNSALGALLHYKAVIKVEQGGQLWWAATPETDTRIRTVHERTPEMKKRRPKRAKV